MRVFKKNFLNKYLNLIPKYRTELLWIRGRDSIEYNNKLKKENIGDGKVVFKSSYNEEPSLIYPKLKINECDNPLTLGYYPSYKKLDTCQRYTYLKWLENVENTIDIGYLFLYYYGLERNLMFGNFEQAVYEIDKLRTYHKNSSFQHYSSEAITFSCLYKGRIDLIEEVDAQLDFSELLAFTKLFLTRKFYTEDIINSAKFVGFNNTRYINEYHDLFAEEMDRQLLEENSKNFIEFSESEIMNSPKVFVRAFANVSLEKKFSSVPIQKVFENDKIKTYIYKLLSSTHENVKVLLKETKKNKTL